MLLDKSLPQILELIAALETKAEEFDDVVKVGRTQLQDAVPIRLGQEFNAYATALKRGAEKMKKAREDLFHVNMGGTAIGTSITASEGYVNNIGKELADVTGYPMKVVDDLVDGTQHIDSFVAVSAAVKQCSIAMSKMANDLRLLSMGPRAGVMEIALPPRQNGSSIMPGKINPAAGNGLRALRDRRQRHDDSIPPKADSSNSTRSNRSSSINSSNRST